MHYGFIGTGNIASAIITGVLRKGNVNAGQISVFDANNSVQADFVDKFGVNGCADLSELIQKADIVFLAVKPNIYPALLPVVKGEIQGKATILVSLAAGQTLQAIESIIGGESPIVRVMPNMNAAVCEAITALCVNKSTSLQQKKQVETFFNQTGMTMEIDEKLFGVFCAIAGCSPAFTYLYIDSLAKGAQKNGMSKKQALQIATQAVLGSAKMLLESDEHPWALIDKVCSPGGTTIEGVCTLEDFCFESAVVHAVDAAVQKDLKMQG